MTLLKPSATSGSPVTLPLRIPPCDDPYESNALWGPMELSNSILQQQPLSTHVEVMLSTSLDPGAIMPEQNLVYNSSDRDNQRSRNDVYEGSYLEDLLRQYPSITFDVKTPTPDQASVLQYHGKTLTEAKMISIDHDPMLWDTLPPFSQSDFEECRNFEATTSFGMLDPYTSYSCPIDDVEGCQPDYSKSASEVSVSSPGYAAEDLIDKPYARLIYEALMQAPGHRMMLRDIYDWFAKNTCKAQGSSLNGWQNSIRHNLSMNQVREAVQQSSMSTNQQQAFENDKPDQSSCRSGRKANSVWYLTDDALRNGVQSTTRFRKSGPAKRCQNQCTNQTQRHKSSGRGRKATKRASVSRKPGSTPPSEQSARVKDEHCCPFYQEMSVPLTHVTPSTADYPMTPDRESLYGHLYHLPSSSHPEAMNKLDEEMLHAETKNMLQDYSTDTVYGDFTAFEQESVMFSHDCA